MVCERITPERGLARYAGDPTQGPACAMAAGAATIHRNYLVPVADAGRDIRIVCYNRFGQGVQDLLDQWG
ncbi:MAG: hypothetical protein KDB56_03485 [Mycobacterium sp.]|nr:hypothetical protein [Mycobacterium sp.]